MPIRAEMRWFYPIDWPQISRHVRFERAGGSCQGCGRPHGETVAVQRPRFEPAAMERAHRDARP